MSTLTLLRTPDCHLCEQALSILLRLQTELSFELVVRDVSIDQALHRLYLERVPVVELDGEELFEYFVDEQQLRERLQEKRT